MLMQQGCLKMMCILQHMSPPQSIHTVYEIL